MNILKNVTGTCITNGFVILKKSWYEIHLFIFLSHLFSLTGSIWPQQWHCFCDSIKISQIYTLFSSLFEWKYRAQLWTRKMFLSMTCMSLGWINLWWKYLSCSSLCHMISEKKTLKNGKKKRLTHHLKPQDLCLFYFHKFMEIEWTQNQWLETMRLTMMS